MRAPRGCIDLPPILKLQVFDLDIVDAFCAHISTPTFYITRTTQAIRNLKRTGFKSKGSDCGRPILKALGISLNQV